MNEEMEIEEDELAPPRDFHDSVVDVMNLSNNNCFFVSFICSIRANYNCFDSSCAVKHMFKENQRCSTSVIGHTADRKEKRKKDQRPAGFEPMTSLS